MIDFLLPNVQPDAGQDCKLDKEIRDSSSTVPRVSPVRWMVVCLSLITLNN